jgi:hypothetical protein
MANTAAYSGLRWGELAARARRRHPALLRRGERRIFRLAASLAAGLPVNVRDALTGLDEHNLTLAISAFIHASGHRPPQLEP